MYKTTSDRQHDIARTGSHGTKPMATGRVEVLPPGADPWAAIFNDVRTQRRIAVENYETAMRQLQDVNWAIRMASDHKEQAGLLIKRNAILARRDTLARQLVDLRKEIVLAARSAMGERFRMVAKRMLLHEQYVAITDSVRDINDDPDLTKWAKESSDPPPKRNRHISGLKDRGASEEQLAHRRALDRQHEKRKHLRKRLIG
jgi:hypothetical protein